MSMSLKGITKIIALAGMLAVFCGCAATDLHVRAGYQPVTTGKATGTNIVLASGLEGTIPGASDRIQWVIGEVRESGGRIKGNVYSALSPSAIVRNALQQELMQSGYTTTVDKHLPSSARHGLVLSAAALQLDETSSLVKVEAECKVSFSVEIWIKGVKTNTLSFESRYSDFAVRDREKLHQDVMQKALASAFSRALPSIITQLGK